MEEDRREGKVRGRREKTKTGMAGEREERKGRRQRRGRGRLVGWLEFIVPFQHKYGYIRDERSRVESYPLTQRRKASNILTSTLVIFFSASTQEGKGIKRLI